MSMNLLKVIDVHKNEQGQVIEMLVTPDNDNIIASPEDELNKAVWMKVQEVIDSLNQGTMALTNMSMDILRRVSSNEKQCHEHDGLGETLRGNRDATRDNQHNKIYISRLQPPGNSNICIKH